MRLAHNKIDRIVIITSIVIMLILLSWSVYFIYSDVYKIIIMVPTLNDLQMKVSFDIIRVDLFEQIMEKLQHKMVAKEINWLTIKNPF